MGGQSAVDDSLNKGLLLFKVKMGRREVERWDPPNKEMPKYPIPLWGATSVKVPGKEAVGPIFQVKRDNDFAANALKADPLTQPKPEMGDKVISYPCYPVGTRNMASQESVHPNPPVMLEDCQPWLLVLPMASLMAKMFLCLSHQGLLAACLQSWLVLFSLVLELAVVPTHQCPCPRMMSF